jgi:hypothetical protein
LIRMTRQLQWRAALISYLWLDSGQAWEVFGHCHALRRSAGCLTQDGAYFGESYFTSFFKEIISCFLKVKNHCIIRKFFSFTTAIGWTASIWNAGLRRTLGVRELHDDGTIKPQSENFQIRD